MQGTSNFSADSAFSWPKKINPYMAFAPKFPTQSEQGKNSAEQGMF
jgi:hypothetical protein